MSQVGLKLSVQITKHGKRFVAWAPALDLSTSGRTIKEAQHRFEQAAEIFFEELAEAGTVDTVLAGLGWKKAQRLWAPPKIVKEKIFEVNIPVIA